MFRRFRGQGLGRGRQRAMGRAMGDPGGAPGADPGPGGDVETRRGFGAGWGPGQGHGHGRGGHGGRGGMRRHRGGGGECVMRAGQSLNEIRPGGVCRIHALHGRGAIRHRLMDLGLVPNAPLEVVRSAPLDDPIEVRVGDTFVTLRRAEAARVEVVDA